MSANDPLKTTEWEMQWPYADSYPTLNIYYTCSRNLNSLFSIVWSSLYILWGELNGLKLAYIMKPHECKIMYQKDSLK